MEIEGQDFVEIDLLAGLPTRNLKLETGPRDQQAPDATRTMCVSDPLGDFLQTIWR
jgi:hypothetical protein